MKKGTQVRVRPYTRTRTIFNGSEVSPGHSTSHAGGWTGTVTNIFDGPLPIEVKREGTSPGIGFYEFEEDELEIVE